MIGVSIVWGTVANCNRLGSVGNPNDGGFLGPFAWQKPTIFFARRHMGVTWLKSRLSSTKDFTIFFRQCWNQVLSFGDLFTLYGCVWKLFFWGIFWPPNHRHFVEKLWRYGENDESKTNPMSVFCISFHVWSVEVLKIQFPAWFTTKCGSKWGYPKMDYHSCTTYSTPNEQVCLKLKIIEPHFGVVTYKEGPIFCSISHIALPDVSPPDRLATWAVRAHLAPIADAGRAGGRDQAILVSCGFVQVSWKELVESYRYLQISSRGLKPGLLLSLTHCGFGVDGWNRGSSERMHSSKSGRCDVNMFDLPYFPQLANPSFQMMLFDNVWLCLSKGAILPDSFSMHSETRIRAAQASKFLTHKD